MNILKNQIITLLFAFLICSFSSVYPPDLFANEDVIWQAGTNIYFKYAKQDKPNSGNNDHPAELKESEISAVLKLLKFRENEHRSSEEKLKSVFTVKQANMLGLYLANGLKNAKLDQDIIFAMERSTSNLLGLISEQFFVAGRAFYKDKKLNVIIGDFDRPRNKGYEAAYDPTHVGIVRYHFDHGRRARSSKGFKLAGLKVAGVENKQIMNTLRDDWLVIDVAEASAAFEHKRRMHKEVEMEAKRKEIKQILDTEELNRPRKATSSLEERLTILKRLRDKDLISDEEYSQKRKQMLDDL